jgi:DNA-binding transcriptional regulator YdaS (Cro superfamily)
MANNLAHRVGVRHPVLPDIGRPAPAKANVRIPDIAWMEAIGRAIAIAVAMVGWSHKEAAAKVGVDDAEFGKWLSGHRRAQFDRLLAVDELRTPLIITIAGLDPAAEVKTTIEVRRTA